MRGSVQKRSKGSWRLVFDLERHATGKRRQKVVHFRGTKREAEEELSRIILKCLEKDPDKRKEIYARINEASQKAAQYAIPNEIDRLYQAIGGARINASTGMDRTARATTRTFPPTASA